MDQTGSLLYRKNERAKVQLGISRHLPHEANLLHVHCDMQVRRVCKLLPACHLGTPNSLAEYNINKAVNAVKFRVSHSVPVRGVFEPLEGRCPDSAQ